MFAVKENKVYAVSEVEKASYLKQGYDIVDAEGTIIDHAPTKKITHAEHLKAIEALKAENEALESELEKAKKALAAAKKANA